MQSTRPRPVPAGLHLAVIMDGNGRWAAARGLPRSAGHAAGVETMRRVVTAARTRGLGTLTLFAFSSDNWERPPDEVDALMRLLRDGLEREVGRCVANGVRLSIVGRRDRLGPGVTEVIAKAEEATRGGKAMRLRIALDYSARGAILGAARLCAARTVSPEEFESLLGLVLHDPEPVHPVDLLIRTGGEQRLSDFLLWECAYAELWFSERMWPEFTEVDLDAALAEFCSRERRFGTPAAGGPVRGRRRAMSGALGDLALVGTVLAVTAGLATLVVALMGGRSILAGRAALGVVTLVALYAAVLLGFSLASRERTIAPGGEKSVAGFDPHLHYRVAGPPGHALDGALLVIVRLRSDALRAMQDPRGLSVALVDARGRRWSPVGTDAPARDARDRFAPFRGTLGPGESRAVTLAFRPDSAASGLRLLIVEAGFPCGLTIGHEASPLHRKAFFAL